MRYGLLISLQLLLVTISEANAQLQLVLSPPASDIILGEPVSVRVTLRNSGQEPVKVAAYLKPEFVSVAYRIGRDQDPLEPFSPWAIKEPAKLNVMLFPGRTVEADADLFFDGKRWIFTTAGTYRVQANYLGKLESNILSLTVRAPRNDQEATAANALLSSTEAGRFLLLRGSDHLRSGMEVLLGVSRDQPNTPHASHARLALGVSQLRPFRDFATGGLRPANPQAALELLERVDVSRLGVERTTETVLGRAKALRLLNNEAGARAVESTLPEFLQRRFPGTDVEAIYRELVPALKSTWP
jgi:hypothetical protein